MAKKNGDDDASATLPERVQKSSNVPARKAGAAPEIGSAAVVKLAEIADLGLDAIVQGDAEAGRAIGELMGARPQLKLEVGQSVPILIQGAKLGSGKKSMFLIVNVGIMDPRAPWKTAEEGAKYVCADLDFFVGAVLREDLLSVAVRGGMLSLDEARSCFSLDEEEAAHKGWNPKQLAERKVWAGRLTLQKRKPGAGASETEVYTFELYR